MQTKGNTILITGGGSGIGRALAQAFHRRGNTVIVAGRRKAALDELAQANPGMATAVVDLADARDIARFAADIARDYPSLNALVNNAGIMQPEDWRGADVNTDIAEAIIATNLVAPLRLTAALLPLLRGQPEAALLNVSSGLAFLPLALTPTYSATKAALHSMTESLRYQLKDTGVQVIEIAPPYVQTGLMGEQQASDPNAMPLAAFVDEAMTILDTQPDVREVLVERVRPLRFAAEQGYEGYMRQFDELNDHFAAH
jgi:uncharacterized oxidoreductase